MLSVYTYYADKSLPIRERPGDIHFSNINCENIDRFLHYNLSGNETWQLGTPLNAIYFDNVNAIGIKLPLCAYSSADVPFSLHMTDCSITFESPVKEVIRGAFIEKVQLENVSINGTPDSTPLVRSWGGEAPAFDTKKLSGVAATIAQPESPFIVDAI